MPSERAAYSCGWRTRVPVCRWGLPTRASKKPQRPGIRSPLPGIRQACLRRRSIINVRPLRTKLPIRSRCPRQREILGGAQLAGASPGAMCRCYWRSRWLSLSLGCCSGGPLAIGAHQRKRTLPHCRTSPARRHPWRNPRCTRPCQRVQCQPPRSGNRRSCRLQHLPRARKVPLRRARSPRAPLRMPPSAPAKSQAP
jgi:hypothetical protein